MIRQVTPASGQETGSPLGAELRTASRFEFFAEQTALSVAAHELADGRLRPDTKSHAAA